MIRWFSRWFHRWFSKWFSASFNRSFRILGSTQFSFKQKPEPKAHPSRWPALALRLSRRMMLMRLAPHLNTRPVNWDGLAKCSWGFTAMKADAINSGWPGLGWGIHQIQSQRLWSLLDNSSPSVCSTIGEGCWILYTEHPALFVQSLLTTCRIGWRSVKLLAVSHHHRDWYCACNFNKKFISQRKCQPRRKTHGILHPLYH